MFHVFYLYVLFAFIAKVRPLGIFVRLVKSHVWKKRRESCCFFSASFDSASFCTLASCRGLRSTLVCGTICCILCGLAHSLHILQFTSTLSESLLLLMVRCCRQSDVRRSSVYSAEIFFSFLPPH